MYRIALVDDQLKWRESMAQEIRQSLAKLSIDDYDKNIFDNGSALLSELGRGEHYDIVFTDIYLKQENGLDLAKKIREASPQTRVALFSSTSDYVYEGYDVSAIYYFMKPVDSAKLTSVLGRDYYANHVRQSIRVIETSGDRTVLALRDIFYIEHYYGTTRLLTKDGTIETTQKLSDLMKKLPRSSFLHCQKSFIVNLAHVRSIDRYAFTLVNQTDVPISKLQYLKVRESYEQFLLAQTQYR